MYHRLYVIIKGIYLRAGATEIEKKVCFKYYL